jgi:hypothetical protein
MMSEQTFTISNPRREEIIEDWPLGRNERGPATFTHEVHPTRGERIGRQTPYKGRMGKIKYTTYSQSCRLVDGSDGKTHIVSFSSGFVQVMSCDMKHSDFSVFGKDENFAEYKAMAFSE